MTGWGQTFPNKLNAIAGLKFKLSCHDVKVQQIDCYTTGNLP